MRAGFLRKTLAPGLVTLMILSSSLFLMTTAPAAAESASGQGLQVSPVTVELNGDPGKSYDINITVQNVTTGDLFYRSFVNDFKAKDETGTPQVLLDQNLPDSLSLVHWVAPIAALTIKSKQSVVVPVHITIPATTEPGGHYGVVRFSGIAPDLKDTGVALAASVGTLILVRVSGQAHESLQLKDFFAARNGKRGSFFETGPLTLTERIANSGNVHLKPRGNIVVKDLTGRVIQTLAVNSDGGNILPQSVRRFQQELNKNWLFGRYSASLDLTYGTQGQVLQGTLVFWVIPWKLVVIALLAILMLITLLRFLLKRYNARVIRKAQGRN